MARNPPRGEPVPHPSGRVLTSAVSWRARPASSAHLRHPRQGRSHCITVRENLERDWADLAFLLTLVPDPVVTAAELNNRQRQKLRDLGELPNEAHSPGDRTAHGHA